MTYATDNAANYHRVGFYVAFDGIATRLSTHNPTHEAGWTPSGTFVAAIKKSSVSGFDETLNREFGFVEQGSLSFSALNTAAVAALFVRRGGTDDTISASINAATTTISLTDNALPTSGIAYVGRETVNITGDSGSDRTVTRGYLGSTAGPWAVGTKISTAPIFWYTRRATVYAVHLDTGTETELFTGTLSASPTFTDGVWAVEITGSINDLLKRPICSGWREQEAIGAKTLDSGALEFEIVDAANFVTPGWVRIDAGDFYAIAGGWNSEIAISTAADPDTITIDNRALMRGNFPTGGRVFDEVDGKSATLKQIDAVFGKPGEAALQILTSTTGLGNNGAHDVLAGQERNVSGGDENTINRRMGAGIPVALIDQATFNLIPGERILAWVDEPGEVGEFLFSEVLWRSGGFVYCTGAGVLTFALYTPVHVRGGRTSYTASDVISSTVTTVDDETGHLASVTFECNYVPELRKFKRKVDLVFRGGEEIYGDRGRSIEQKTKSLWVGTADARDLVATPSDLITVEAMFDRQRARQEYAGRRLAVRVPWKLHAIMVPGYRFNWTDPRMPDHEGGTVAGRTYEVTGRKVDLTAGTSDIECDEVPRGWAIAPSCFVGSFDGGTNTITIDTTGPEADHFDDASPGLDFAAGWAVTIYDASDNFLTSETLEVDSAPGAATLAMEADTAFGIAAGDLVVLSQTADKSVTNDVGADVEDFAFAADSSHTVGASNFAGPRWS